MPTNHNDGAQHAHAGAVVEKEKGNIMAVFAYLSILIVIPFLTEAKNDPFVKYHIKQGLTLIIYEVAGWILNWFLVFIPFIGWFIMMLWWLIALVLLILGIMNVLNGQEKELPLIGQYASRFTF